MFAWFLLVSHRLFLYSSSTGKCIAQPGLYEKYDAYFEVIVSGIFPPIIVILLGCALLHNVRQVVQRRIVPATIAIPNPPTQSSSIEHIDSQITKMLFLQSLVAIPSFLLYGAQITYSSVTEGWYKSPEFSAWETIFVEFIRLGSYVFNATSFYISFLTSRSFRRTFFRLLHLRCFRNQTTLTNIHIRSNSMHAVRKQELRS